MIPQRCNGVKIIHSIWLNIIGGHDLRFIFQDVLYNKKCKKYETKNIFMAGHLVSQQDSFLDALLGAANKDCVKAVAWSVWNLFWIPFWIVSLFC